MKQLLKRYMFAIAFVVLNVAILLLYPDRGMNSLAITERNVVELLSILPPIFVLLGLLDVWVEKEKFVKHMGDESGIKGVLLALLIGSAAAGPLYVAFPIALMLIKKGVRMMNVYVFIGAWSTTKIPMILFEASSIGYQYTVLRYIFNTIGIIVIAFILDKTTSAKQVEVEPVVERVG